AKTPLSFIIFTSMRPPPLPPLRHLLPCALRRALPLLAPSAAPTPPCSLCRPLPLTAPVAPPPSACAGPADSAPPLDAAMRQGRGGSRPSASSWKRREWGAP